MVASRVRKVAFGLGKGVACYRSGGVHVPHCLAGALVGISSDRWANGECCTLGGADKTHRPPLRSTAWAG